MLQSHMDIDFFIRQCLDRTLLSIERAIVKRDETVANMAFVTPHVVGRLSNIQTVSGGRIINNVIFGDKLESFSLVRIDSLQQYSEILRSFSDGISQWRAS